jgi:membrane-associated protein
MIPMGYFLGTHYPSIVNYLEYIIIAFVVFTAIPVIIGFLKLRIETKKPESGKPNQFIL